MSFDIFDSAMDEPLDIIYTKSVKQVETAIKVGMRMPVPTILLITGIAGIGKTKAIEHFILSHKPQVHTGLNICEVVEVPRNPTRLSLPVAILEQLGEHPNGRNSPALVRQTINALRDNELRLLIFDEGNRLTNDSFEVLKTLHDAAIRRKTNCRLAIVGLSSIVDLVEKHEQFDSRAAIHTKMNPLDETEIIDDFLPNLNLPRWRFDPTNRIDQELGKLLWLHSEPSLRRLVTWISTAVCLAEIDEVDWATLDHINDAATLMRFAKKEYQEIDVYKGVHERISELRNAYKELKRSRKGSSGK